MKKKYEMKLLHRVRMKESRDFLLAHLKKEWEATEAAIEKDRSRRKLYDAAQKAGMSLGFVILGMTAVCGVLAVGAVAPNIFSAFGRLGRYRRYFHKSDFRKQIYHFQRRGFLNIKRSGADTMEIKLTDLGKAQIIKRALGNVRIVPQEQWDGIWRIVLFDIPERNRWARVGMRESLKRMGFYRFQKSAFVFPYPCREEIEFLTRLYNVRYAVRFIETTSVNQNDDMRAFFFPSSS
ncbi:MAG: phenylacetic acid degradation operon negative regulatory protein [Parcubacteria group bacterium Greene0714_36]|nr:MAG: phenylacetic acid degradation operon negative regulatory protein [Parcubacteria group bacterium Greene0714_36]